MRLKVFGIFMTLAAPVSLAQELTRAQSNPSFTWSDCVQETSLNNLELKAARENLSSAEALIESAKSGFLPTLNGTVNASHSILSATSNLLPSGNNTANGVAYASALNLNTNLFSGLKDQGVLARARANRSILEATLDRIRANVSDELRQAYIKLNYAIAYVKLAAIIQDRRAQNERLVRAQYENGRENQGSYLLSQSKLEQAKFDYLQGTHQEITAEEVLLHVLGKSSFDSALNSRSILIASDLPHSDPPENPSLLQMIERTPVHRIQEGQIAVSNANVKISKSEYFPRLDLTSTLQNRNHLLYTGGTQDWSVGLNLTIPLFSGLSTYSNTKSALALEQNAEATALLTDFQTWDNLRQSLFAFQESVERLKVDTLSMRAIEVQEKIARKQYNNGILNFENWDIIEGNLVSAQKTALLSERDRALSESTFRLAQGLGDLP